MFHHDLTLGYDGTSPYRNKTFSVITKPKNKSSKDGENMVGISLLLSVANADKEIMLDLAATST